MPTIPEQHSFMVVKSNDLIQKSRFALTTQQNKIMLYLISKIKPSDTGTEMYEVSIRDFCELCNIDENSGKNHSDAKIALKALADKSVWVQQPDGTEVLLRWLNRVRLNHRTNCFEISFHEDMLPYLYDLRARYTQYSLDNVLTMKSKYGIRLYELLKSYQHVREEISFSVDELKKRLDAESYERYPDFRRFVLDKAIEDINACSDIEVQYTAYKGKGRSIESIVFSVFKPNALASLARKSVKRQRLYGKGEKK